MKVYFTASARGKNQYSVQYKQIFEKITDLGHTHLDEFLFEVDEENLYDGAHEDQVRLYEKAMHLIKSSDVVILEVSIHSLSMGYVLHKALETGKPVIALFLKGNEPYFALGIDNDKLQVVEYEVDNLKDRLSEALDYSQDQMDTRFNFFISPKHQNYLDWISKEKKIPRAVFLRDLIEREMEADDDFNAKN